MRLQTTLSPLEIQLKKVMPLYNPCNYLKGCNLVFNTIHPQKKKCNGTIFDWYHAYFDEQLKKIVELGDSTMYSEYHKQFTKLTRDSDGNWISSWDNSTLENIANTTTEYTSLKRLSSQGKRCNEICKNDDKCIARTEYTESSTNCTLIKNPKGNTKSDLSTGGWFPDDGVITICRQKHFDLIKGKEPEERGEAGREIVEERARAAEIKKEKERERAEEEEKKKVEKQQKEKVTLCNAFVNVCNGSKKGPCGRLFQTIRNTCLNGKSPAGTKVPGPGGWTKWGTGSKGNLCRELKNLCPRDASRAGADLKDQLARDCLANRWRVRYAELIPDCM
tara:strand:- start:404 stop:1405 length:1002 start_codon:yes stop_codon:yes gene_type:complete